MLLNPIRGTAPCFFFLITFFPKMQMKWNFPSLLIILLDTFSESFSPIPATIMKLWAIVRDHLSPPPIMYNLYKMYRNWFCNNFWFSNAISFKLSTYVHIINIFPSWRKNDVIFWWRHNGNSDFVKFGALLFLQKIFFWKKRMIC